MASQFPIQLAQGIDSAHIRYMPVTAAQTFITGALVTITLGVGTVGECGADPATILGIAMAPASIGLATTGSIYGGTQIPVYILQPDTVCFMASATTPVQATHQFVLYGIEKTTNWRVDTTDVANTRVTVVDISNTPLQEGFYVKFLAANLLGDSIVS